MVEKEPEMAGNGGKKLRRLRSVQKLRKKRKLMVEKEPKRRRLRSMRVRKESLAPVVHAYSYS